MPTIIASDRGRKMDGHLRQAGATIEPPALGLGKVQ
jgi:hypothetical protein